MKALLGQGDQVRAADIRPLEEWKQARRDAVNLDRMNLSDRVMARVAAEGCDVIYHLAADSAGWGTSATTMPTA